MNAQIETRLKEWVQQLLLYVKFVTRQWQRPQLDTLAPITWPLVIYHDRCSANGCPGCVDFYF